MHDPGAVRDRERARDLARNLDGFVGRDGAGVHPLAQGDAFDELRRDVVSRVHLSDLVDGHDVRMIQSRSEAGFALQTSQPGIVRCERGREKLERDLAAEPLIAGAINDAHPAHAGDGIHSIRAEILADQSLRIGDEQGRRDREGRPRDKVAGVIVILQEQLDPMPQRLVAVATALEDGGALARRLLHRPVEDFGATLPALRVHPAPPR